ncbi:uncharacterized protein LOC143288838 [Babylonia areolata]|uniref:uncharacterized protein LOC143288838 n=1 Tax=Babylonia areolata TaxID=304850 RepID=UPI003FCF17C8
MPQPGSLSRKCAAFVILSLLTSLTSSEGATLPSGTSVTSASSAVPTANQRSARSAEGFLPAGRDHRDRGGEGCPGDFVEQFFRVLSGPVGREAEALLAAVLKLLSENHGVKVTPQPADRGVAEESQHALLPTPPDHQHPPTSKRRLQQHQLSEPESFKRRLPKFNPTGWRRKRAAAADEHAVQNVLREVLDKLTAARPLEVVLPELAQKPPEVGSASASPEWRDKKRESLRKVLQRLPKELKPKRRPLEFNPTGW